jgi:hypothetical protein
LKKSLLVFRRNGRRLSFRICTGANGKKRRLSGQNRPEGITKIGWIYKSGTDQPPRNWNELKKRLPPGPDLNRSDKFPAPYEQRMPNYKIASELTGNPIAFSLQYDSNVLWIKYQR